MAIDTSNRQIAFARVITDQVSFANLVDVFVLEGYRGLGISNKLMRAVMDHPHVSNIRRFTLTTSTAPWLYQKFGFNSLSRPDFHMEIYNKDIYLSQNKTSE